MNRTNLLIDLGVLSAFLIAMEPPLTGIAIHEWLSIALAATIVVHLLLHWKWIISVGADFFRKLFHSSRLKFVVDVLLFVAFTAVMMTGIMISESVLRTLGIPLAPNRAYRSLHSLAADASMLLVALHFALSWNWVVNMTRRYLLDPVAGLFWRKTPALTTVEVLADSEQK
jgi:hypothetical protein